MLPRLRTAWTNWPRRMQAEWIGVCVIAVTLAVLLLLSGATTRFDNIVYDASLRLGRRPPSPNIIIVAIDDRSLAESGAWPWSRRLHAALLDRLTAAGARAVAYDVLFVEPSAAPGDDQALADALRASGRVCLPVLTEAPGPNGAAFQLAPPVAPLAQAAAGLGHVGLDFDPDGVSRRANLSQEAGGRSIDHLMRCAVEVGRGHALHAAPADLPRPDGGAPLARRDAVLIPYGGGPGRVRTISAASVLRAETPPGFFRDQYVIVGATAGGLHDRHSTPVSTRNETMAGVEVQANLLEGLLTGRFIRTAPVWAGLGATLTMVGLFLFSLLRAPPRWNMAVGVGILATALALSVALLVLARIWLPPFPTVLTLLLVFPLWGWRRLEAASGYMIEELARFAEEPGVVTAGPLPVSGGDVVERRIALMHHAVRRARDLRAFAAAAAVRREQAVQLLSHDMRLPQSAILALLETSAPGAMAPELAEQLSGYARRTLALAEGFVHLARAESGRLSFETLDVSDLLIEAMDELWPLARRAGVRLIGAGTEEERLVLGDRPLLSRAVFNLLDNAVKYSPSGGTVTSTLSHISEDGRDFVRLTISDQGPGLDPGEQARLFRRFERADDSHPGVGLGLSLVDETARRHGGEVGVESRPGAGASFILVLPLSA